MDDTAETHIGEQREPGERMLWVGKPAAGLRLGTRSILYLLLCFTLIGLSVILLVSTGRPRLPALIPILCVFWVAKGLWEDAKLREGMLYAIDDHFVKVYSADTGRWHGFPLETLTDIWVEVHRDGTGSIFARSNELHWPRDEDGHPVSVLIFCCVQAPATVHDLLIKARAGRLAEQVREDRAGTHDRNAATNGHTGRDLNWIDEEVGNR